MKVFQEVTEWSDSTQNHIYFMNGSKSKVYAYIRKGTKTIFEFKRPLKIDPARRKFLEIENQWRYVAKEEPEVEEKPSGQTWTVTGSKGDQYIVSLDGERWSCTCSGFQFRSRCRHVDAQRSSVQQSV